MSPSGQPANDIPDKPPDRQPIRFARDGFVDDERRGWRKWLSENFQTAGGVTAPPSNEVDVNDVGLHAPKPTHGVDRDGGETVREVGNVQG